jgi:hypothetical protein
MLDLWFAAGSFNHCKTTLQREPQIRKSSERRCAAQSRSGLPGCRDLFAELSTWIFFKASVSFTIAAAQLMLCLLNSNVL